MPDQNHAKFYEQMPALSMALPRICEQPNLFAELPESWHVIITDIKNSSRAVASGEHQLVNLLATGSIIAVLNIAHRSNTEVPFFFGGDGATILVPDQMKNSCLAALQVHQNNAKVNFGFELRVGAVPMTKVMAASHEVVLAKAQVNQHLAIPIALGAGLQYAENFIKARPENHGQSEHQNREALDLSGMECRWDSVKPPSLPGEVLALLVDATDPEHQGRIFATVLSKIESIYGPISFRNPISRNRLRIKAHYRRLATEITAKYGKRDMLKNLKYSLFTFIGKLYYGKTKSTRLYLDNLVQLSDTLSIDGRINTVFSGSRDQRLSLIDFLEEMEKNGDILFGYHPSPESIMSCYVRNRTDQHIHFVDGSKGGYTQAAKMLKAKWQQAKGHFYTAKN